MKTDQTEKIINNLSLHSGQQNIAKTPFFGDYFYSTVFLFKIFYVKQHTHNFDKNDNKTPKEHKNTVFILETKCECSKLYSGAIF